MNDVQGKPPAIALRQVAFGRSGEENPVLSGIDLTIPAGQWVAIAGANGCGKSTLLRLVNGLLKPTSGDIAINGHALASDRSWEIRMDIGTVFANPDNQFVGATVRDDIAFGLENRQLARDEMVQRVEHYADMLHVTPLLDRHPAMLSGGQKQRVALASVLAMEPSLILFDEATSMLDEGSKNELLALMKEMHSSKRYTMVCVSHDTDELLAAERLIALGGGAIIGDGEPEELFRDAELLQACRLGTPYLLQLSRELKALGLPIKEALTEREVLEQLWTLGWKTSPTATPMPAASRP
ncbi:hypothetical protein A7K91_11370 [Paenibacillus oryzae]|uniref:ABC transporter domain-containing protein n=1 Tax=Paenibacillus oryzae TaxID=1844972 RepID=A0A1A5YEH0_9BACL|nr:ATP-binding cassette domain-containing protein [Paenibacillus oryzae]OBR63988.1 hypothetical protein A7K91_11370 [Paenibacillus oryzae]